MESSPCTLTNCVNNATVHVEFCNKLVGFLLKHPRPATNGKTSFKLAVLIHEEASELEFIWLGCERREGNTAADGYDEPNLDIFLQPRYIHDSPQNYEPLSVTNIPNGVNHSIELWYHSNSDENGGQLNQFANSLSWDFGGRDADWRGPLLFASTVSVGGDPDKRTYEDVTSLVADIVFGYLSTK